MQFKSLEISRTESYATPANVLKGVAMLQGENGQVTVTLSPDALSKIFSVIGEEVAATAKANAKAAIQGMRNAVAEPLLEKQEANLLQTFDE